MKNPWKNNELAFLPMYDDTVKITLKSGESQTIRCMITDDITSEPVTDDGLETNCIRYDFIFPSSEWKLLEQVDRGCTIVSGRGRIFKVQNVRLDYSIGYIVTGKSNGTSICQHR